MADRLDPVLHKKFENEAIQAFQQDGNDLRNTVRMKDAQGASQVQFDVLGQVTTNERTDTQTPLPSQDPSHTPQVATVRNYHATIYTDKFKNNQVSYDERQEVVEALRMAMNRRLDQIVLDSMINASINKTVADNISGSADNMTVAAINDAARQLGSDVPDQDRHVVMHDNGFYHFINESDVKNVDTSPTRALANGMLPEWGGFTLHKMGDRNEGGLPVPSANHRTNFAFQKMAIGLAMNMEPEITIDWAPTHGAHIITGWLSAGAVLVQNSGVVQITTDES